MSVAFEKIPQTSLNGKLQWATKVVETLFDNEAFVVFYLHLALIRSDIPTPNSMLSRCCDLCCLRNRKINIVLGVRGGNVSKMRKIKFYASIYPL